VQGKAVFGGASRQQATKLAQIFVESHNMAMKQRAEFQRAMERSEEASRRLTEAYDKNMATARMAYGMLRKIAEEQGIGEITIFFPVNISKIPKNSLEYERLVRFADYLARESHGRKVIITSVGSASAFGLEKVNKRLGEERAQAPVDIIDHFLVKIPHEFYKIYGTGDMYSPRNVNMKVHKRYQHVHLVALYEEKDKEGASYEGALLPRDRSEAEEPRAEMVKTPPDVSIRTDQLAAERRTSVIAGQETAASVERGVFRNFLGMGFVYIPGGTFIMGSPLGEYGRDDNERQHQVTLTRGFYMQTTEVTQGQWQALMGRNPSHFLNCGWDCPVEQVNWYEVQEFIKRLNEAEKTRRYRLPTEAEWEFASRAGSTTAFHHGEIAGDKSGYDEILDQVGWYYRNSEKGTHQVSQKKSNAWGLYDMHGNVWEWCQDWQRKYPFRAVTDPTGAATGKARIRRGGSWSHYPLFCRSSYRSWYEPKDALVRAERRNTRPGFSAS
jgi:formylglycine-generating enzyme required for sulfatase activity/outer membrane protein OmpA-like peptidoglycan-associated protein